MTEDPRSELEKFEDFVNEELWKIEKLPCEKMQEEIFMFRSQYLQGRVVKK